MPVLTPATAELLGGSPAQPVDAHAIQPFYTGILARDCGLALSAARRGRNGGCNRPLSRLFLGSREPDCWRSRNRN